MLIIHKIKIGWEKSTKKRKKIDILQNDFNNDVDLHLYDSLCILRYIYIQYLSELYKILFISKGFDKGPRRNNLLFLIIGQQEKESGKSKKMFR